jgi:hypothetical protein
VTTQSAIDFAREFLGASYVFGAENPDAREFDCSGLVQYAYRKAGFKLPRTADQQYRSTQRITAKDAQPGDLVYFLDGNGHAYHTGIYMGNGKFLEAPHSGDVVKIANVNVKNVVFGRVKGYQAANGRSEAAGLANNPAPYISYGNVQALAATVPDIKDKLAQAIKEGWSPQKFQDELQTTGWWKTHSDSAKKFIAMQASDPGEYKQELAQAQAHVKQIASQLGVALSDKWVANLATSDLFSGLDDATLSQSIGALYNNLPQVTGGQSVAMQQQLKSLAASYGLPVTQSWIDSHIKQSLSTGTGLEGATQDLINQAKSAFPSLSSQIDAGQTVQQIAQPFIAQMAQTLEIDPSQINLTDPTIQRALTGQVQAPAITGQPQTGQPTSPGVKGTAASSAPQPMTLFDFQKQLKNDPRWGNTDNAKQTAYGLMHSLGQAFGFAS